MASLDRQKRHSHKFWIEVDVVRLLRAIQASLTGRGSVSFLGPGVLRAELLNGVAFATLRLVTVVVPRSGSGGRLFLRKAFPAQNRPPLGGPEGDGGFFAALRAGGASFDAGVMVAIAARR